MDELDKRPFMVGADAIEFGSVEGQPGHIAVLIKGLGQHLRLAEDVSVVLALSPSECRLLARELERRAREALGE